MSYCICPKSTSMFPGLIFRLQSLDSQNAFKSGKHSSPIWICTVLARNFGQVIPHLVSNRNVCSPLIRQIILNYNDIAHSSEPDSTALVCFGTILFAFERARVESVLRFVTF